MACGGGGTKEGGGKKVCGGWWVVGRRSGGKKEGGGWWLSKCVLCCPSCAAQPHCLRETGRCYVTARDTGGAPESVGAPIVLLLDPSRAPEKVEVTEVLLSGHRKGDTARHQNISSNCSLITHGTG